MWIRQPILDRMRRQHLTGGLLVITITLELGLGGWVSLGATFVMAGLVVLDTALIGTSNPLGNSVRRLSSASVHIAFGLLAIAIIRLFMKDLPEGIWPGVHEMILYVAILAGAASTGTLVTQLLTRSGRWQQSFLPLSALALAASIGGALGVAASLFAELASYQFLGDLNPYQVGAPKVRYRQYRGMVNGGAWTVESMLTFFMALIGFAALAAWTGDLPHQRNRGESGRFCAARRAKPPLCSVAPG